MKSLLTAMALPALMLFAGQAAAEPAIWKASDEDSEIWLFGSIHALDPDMSWQTDTLMNAVGAADLFYYEIPNGPGTDAIMTQQISAHGINPRGVTLSGLLSDEEQALFDRVASGMGISRPMLDRFRPWLAYITISVTQIEQAGYRAESGVDLNMQELTPDDRERYFESIPQQISFFADMPEDLQVELLTTSLAQIEEEPDMLGHMIHAWRNGDEVTLDEIVNKSMKDLNEDVYDTLIVKRNAAWLSEITNLMEGEENAVIIVGAGHMVGEDGLPSLLQQEGFTVERVQ